MSGKHHVGEIRPTKVSWHKQTIMTEILLDTDAVAAALGCSATKVRRLVRCGALTPRAKAHRPGVLRGRKGYWFTRTSIDNYLKVYGDQP